MQWKKLKEKDVCAFINAHKDGDVRALALKTPPHADWPYALVLDQIKARQKAHGKLPSWAEMEVGTLVFPSSNLIEQASSAATARYKAGLFSGDMFVDLSAGAGADSYAFAQRFKRGVCVERDEVSAAILAHNMAELCGDRVQVVCDTAEAYTENMPHADLVYIDPQRRDDHAKGKFRFADCTPDAPALLAKIGQKYRRALVKAAPMLDIAQGIEDLGSVARVHVVEWRGDCREVLYVLDPAAQVAPDDVPIVAVQIDDEGAVISEIEFTRTKERSAQAEYGMPETYLYEPGPAFQKSGGFQIMATRYGLKKLHPHTHLYTSDAPVEGFPGRRFKVHGICAVNRKALGFDKANLAVRNFPSDVAGLRKKLKLKDGGALYAFACTLCNDTKALVYGTKV